MTSHEVMDEFCGRFPLRKQILKYNGNIHILTIILSRPSGDLWPRLEDTLSLVFLLKSPSIFSKLIRGPLRVSQFMLSSFRSVFSSVDFKNMFSLIYIFATDFVLAIKSLF